MTKYLTAKQVIFLNAMVIKRYTPTETIRVYDEKLLESAIYRPQQSAFGKDAYETIWFKAAALFYSLANNHSFVAGNKRTALAALYLFLWINGLEFKATDYEAEKMTAKIVEQKKPPILVSEIAKWIEEHTEKRRL